MLNPQPIPDVAAMVRQALLEDIGSGDVTAQLIAEDKQMTAQIITREAAVLCGAAWVNEVFHQLDPKIEIAWLAADGDAITANQIVCKILGSARAILSGERSALNFLQSLSGTASLAHRYATAIAGTQTKILDTRKTIPGFRLAQKYAVRCGGCHNHRIGLFDAFLIKENHIAAAGSITAAVIAARKLAPHLLLEIEVEDLSQLTEAIAAKADRILLDNFSLADMRQAVITTAGHIELEASGNIDLNNVRSVAETGVNYISIGALTKNLHAVDLSLRIHS